MKAKFFTTLFLSCSLVLTFASNHLTHVNAIENEEQLTQNETVKPEKYYNPANNYIYNVRNMDSISPDSIEAWVRLPVASTGGTIVGSGYNNNLSFNVNIHGKVGIKWKEKELVHTFSDTSNIADGNWHHVALVRTDDKFTYYLDGEIEGEVSSETSADNHCIGFNFGGGMKNSSSANNRNPLEGFIKQVSIYSGAISQEQVQKDMLDLEITEEDVLSSETTLFGNWCLGDYWTERYIENTLEGEVRAELFSFQKFVEYDDSFGDYDYSFAVFPDIQLMTNYNPNKLHRQIQWLADNKEELKMEFAMFVGDLSDFGQKPELYERAANAMSRLDNIVPYCFVPGNHDYDDNAKTRVQESFKKYFPVSKHSTLPGFGGVFEEDLMSNSYYTFEVPGAKYLVINLEYRPRQSVLRWANTIIDAHPDHRVIMETHSYLTGQGYFSTNAKVGNEVGGGQSIFDDLMRKHDNVFMGFGGHEGMDEAFLRTDYGEKGNKIHSVLCDLQASSYNGDIWIDPFLIVRVNEKKKTMVLTYYSPEHEMVYNIQNQYEIYFADANNPTIGD